MPLLLKLSNLNRINSFYFYPAVYGPATRALNQQRRDVGQYFPIEPLYQLENMAGSIGTDGTAPYMAGNSLWNWWLYEALAETSDRAVMTLNTASLEAYEEAISGVPRKLIVFNPTTQRCGVSLRMRSLAPGRYVLTWVDAAGHTGVPKSYTAEQLTAGIPLELGSLDYIRLELRREDEGVTLERITMVRGTRNQLARAYQLLQERAAAKGVNDVLVGHLQNDFKTAMQDYGNRDYETATRTAEAILVQLGFSVK